MHEVLDVPNNGEHRSEPPMPPLKFGPFSVASQVFHTSPSRLSYALVNLKPLLPGHVLVCPTRCVPRLSQLTTEETADLFVTVKHVSRTVERVFHATSLNVAIQDGADAGQSVPHVHVHIIPRKSHDLDAQGGSDSIYGMMDGESGDIGKAFLALQKYREHRKNDREFTPDADRTPRSEQEMQEEADWLRREMEKDDSS
ncbi:Bis(5'-nucleosyl)-tetraphosphatase [asymmetrical] [Cyphellophora attinorum]|uniref:Bis(5'-adenosyl)-triphosphatase n=1 Tax=Cyphellophora attinorum TaxID=1664694 RepID=A0A0N1P1J2_9EURO|nr:Bis(5'-nucleosyl)-tetraphosphatase [asymmetrical] [Phialophora attinorum]KPI43880.1 Bis(5'-nucleosyl)-tetraphosphatase [asymmetrical] [Phialophora attinorum]